MIFWKRLLHPGDHLQKASPTWWSFARGWSIRMIICKRLVSPDDYLQEARSSGWLLARGQSIRMIICERPVHANDHLQQQQQQQQQLFESNYVLRITLCKNIFSKNSISSIIEILTPILCKGPTYVRPIWTNSVKEIVCTLKLMCWMMREVGGGRRGAGPTGAISSYIRCQASR